ncbi:hypothetical protein FGB62_17g460 [Gracilaria domingensis]|nr:hypothetical protein FGB62_17g460 [Gracilaria domingensis]
MHGAAAAAAAAARGGARRLGGRPVRGARGGQAADGARRGDRAQGGQVFGAAQHRPAVPRAVGAAGPHQRHGGAPRCVRREHVQRA